MAKRRKGEVRQLAFPGIRRRGDNDNLVEVVLPIRISGYKPQKGIITILDCTCRVRWVEAYHGNKRVLAAVLLPDEYQSHRSWCEFKTARDKYGRKVLVAQADLPEGSRW